MKKMLRKKYMGVVSFLVASTFFASAKIYQYAAKPARPKECDFIFPKNTDHTKPIEITAQELEQLVPLKQKSGFTNDASCLNKTEIFGIVAVSSVDDVRKAVLFAKEHGLKITSAGLQHSMGGQSFVKSGLVLDMKGLNQMTLYPERKVLTVESGAIWSEVQKFLDTKELAVQAMQSINIFSVGGTASVNAHGIAHDPGPIAPTVLSMRVFTSDGEIKTASPTENAELFRSVLGGYGLFGVILDLDLAVVPNEMYAWKRNFMDYADFPEYYKKNIADNSDIGLVYGRLSISPSSYLTETIIHTYEKIDFSGPVPPLVFPKHSWINRLVINLSKTGPLGRWIRWTLEKYVEPQIHVCSRNQAMSQKEVCLVSRNQEMYDAMGYLKNRLKDTDILQEYFIPHEQMPAFVDKLRETVKENGANLLNVTIRIVKKDDITALPYAKEDMFAFVLYFNQKFNERESKILQKTTADLIDVATGLGGTFYLPYQLYYSKDQLKKSYPEIDAFFESKREADPTELFTNTFYETYGR